MVELVGVCSLEQCDRQFEMLNHSLQNIINSSQQKSFALMGFGFFVVGTAFATQVFLAVYLFMGAFSPPMIARTLQCVFRYLAQTAHVDRSLAWYLRLGCIRESAGRDCYG